MKSFINTLISKSLAAVALAVLGLTSTAHAQERATVQPTGAQIQVASAQPPHTIIVELDVTGSFVDTILQGDFMDRSTKRIKDLLPKFAGVGSEVRVAIIGQHHESVSGTFDHLNARKFTVTKNRYTPERIASAVAGQLEEYRSDLKSGKIKRQNNTAVAMSLDHAAEIVRLNGNKGCVIFAISDFDESEYKTIPEPATPGALQGCSVYVFGAGITLAEGSQAQRALKSAWQQYMKQAGVAAKDFYWVPNP
jgi:hypothetical protein